MTLVVSLVLLFAGFTNGCPNEEKACQRRCIENGHSLGYCVDARCKCQDTDCPDEEGYCNRVCIKIGYQEGKCEETRCECVLQEEKRKSGVGCPHETDTCNRSNDGSPSERGGYLPREFLEGRGWCTIGSKTQVNRPNAQSNTQNGAPSRTGKGADGNRPRSRQPRNVKQQVIRSSKMPLLPRNDFKIVIRPRGGLDVATTGTVRLASAIHRAANVPAHEAGEDTVCSNNRQNIIVVSTPHATHAAKYRQLQAIPIGDRRHEVSAYETAPDYTVKGIIKGIPLEEDARSIHTNIVHARNPHALAAKRLSNTTTVIVAFEGPRVPTYVRYGGALLRCTLYRKQVDMCHCCGRLGHRMEVCPNPQDKVCRGCDAPNPGPDHQYSPPLQAVRGAHT
ncbi:hypothetical protein MTO96_050503 [Rhipicephalus appendiculatus]